MRGTVGLDGIYVISLCPRDYTANHDVKQACETHAHVSDDVIHRLPVSGGHSSLVYRNIYCAACHNEPSPRFWLVAVARCDGESTGDECQLTFHPTSYDETAPRSCLDDISRCADDWQNTTLAAMCRQSAASLLTDGQRVFRNRYCARCNDVDDAQLRCVQLPPLLSSLDDVGVFNASRFDVVYDVNEAQLEVAAAVRCADAVYDPLSSRCVALPYCASSWTHCRQSASRRAARDATLDCRAIDSSDVVRYDNGSVFVLSLQTLFNSDSCRHENDTVYVCLPHQSATLSVTLFTLHDVQRLVSVVATVVGLLALVVLLSSYCLLVSCMRNNTSKMAVCLVVSILLYHVVYLVVLAGSRLRFIFTAHLRLASLVVCAGLQYFAMAAFFWLHVLSVEAFRAVRLWYMTDTVSVTSCTALLVYSLYAWCVPALLVAWSTALPLLHGSSQVVVDQSHSQSCCVLGVIQLMLFVVPVALSLFINVVLYALTALMLCRHGAQQYDTDTLLPDRHSPKVDTEWTSRSWSAERLRAERRANDAASRRWKDIYVTCMHTSLLLAATWTLGLLPVTGWIDWPDAVWYVYIVFDLALVVTVCLSWCSVERVWYILTTRKRHRCNDDDIAGRTQPAAAASASAGRVGATGRRTPPAFNDAGSLRLLMRETSI